MLTRTVLVSRECLRGFGFRVEALRSGVSGSGDDVGGLEPLWNIRGDMY